MKDFDALRSEREQRDRTFKIAGREFRFRPAIPAQTHGLYFDFINRFSGGEWPAEGFDVLNATILELLEEDSRAAWREVIAEDAAHPISVADMIEVVEHCSGVLSRRPTEQPGPSGNTGKNGTPPSTDSSASQAAPAPTSLISVPG